MVRHSLELKKDSANENSGIWQEFVFHSSLPQLLLSNFLVDSLLSARSQTAELKSFLQAKFSIFLRFLSYVKNAVTVFGVILGQNFNGILYN